MPREATFIYILFSIRFSLEANILNAIIILARPIPLLRSQVHTNKGLGLKYCSARTENFWSKKQQGHHLIENVEHFELNSLMSDMIHSGLFPIIVEDNVQTKKYRLFGFYYIFIHGAWDPSWRSQ